MTETLVVVVIAAATAVLPSRVIKWQLRRVADWSIASPPAGLPADTWAALVTDATPRAAAITGGLERLLSFVSFSYGTTTAPFLIAGWFAFKVASKWEVWSNIVKMPESLAGSSDLDYLVARSRLGSVLRSRFLIGTLGNVGFGFLAKHLADFVIRLFS